MGPRRTRRAMLAGLAAAPALAGCLEGEDDEDGEGNGTDEEGDGGDTDDGTATEDGYDLSVSHDIESWEGYDPDWSAPTDPPPQLEYEVVIERLEIPWDLAFGSNGDLFVSERTGTVLWYDSESIEALARADVLERADAVGPGEDGGWWAAGSEGGLLGIAVHPRYPDVSVVYACYTYEEEGEYYNRLVSYDLASADGGETGATETVLIDGIPGHEIAHNGARLAFGPANYLWMTTGDALQNGRDEGEPDEALPPDPDSLAGKLLRLEPDGEPAPDNPFAGSEVEGDPRIYALGLRNPQGLSFLPDGRPVVTDHGGAARDEVMVVEAGDDHGWPEAEDGESYSGTDYARPVVNTGPDETWAPSGCVFATGNAPSALVNRLLVGTLAGQHVNAVTLFDGGERGEGTDADGGVRYDAGWLHDGLDAVSHRLLPDELGRVRHVEQAPDGRLYAITSNRDGRSDDGTFPRERDDVLVRIEAP